jgi:hypothetical protein
MLIHAAIYVVNTDVLYNYFMETCEYFWVVGEYF